MLPTIEALSAFVGGQLECYSEKEYRIYRGEIEAIAVEGDDTLKIRFVWLAKSQPAGPREWASDGNLEWVIQSWGSHGTGDHLKFLRVYSTNPGEQIALLPPDSCTNLDRAEVRGLGQQA